MDSGALRVLSPLATENTTQPAEAERKWGSRMAIGGLAYFLLAKFGMTLFSLQPSNITVLWLPSGIGLLMCLAGGVRVLPFILVASFAANYHGMALTSEMGQVLHTLVAAAADTLAAWLAAFMLRRHLPSGLSRPFDLLPFALFVCLLPTLVSASILATNLVWGGYIPAPQAIDFVFMLLDADGLGILVCYPLRELWNPSWRESFVEKALPWILETGVLLLIVHLAFTQFSALIFLLIPAFLYLTFQGRRLSVHLGLALTVCLIVAEAAGGLGPFAGVGPEQGRLQLVFFLFCMAFAVTGMWLQQHQLLSRQALISEQNVQLEKARQAAQAADVAKSQFLANMSHEMRTPLHQVLAMALLMRREPMSDKQIGRLDRLEGACRRMAGLVEAILELTRLEVGMELLQEEPFAIDALLASVVAMVGEQAASKRLSVTVDVSPGLQSAVGDARLIKMALFNYANNAVRFTEQGSVVLRAVLLEEKDDNLHVRFEVADTGIGIAPDDMARLFASFEQVDNSATRKFGGLGVGLSMTRKITDILGGSVGGDSQPGQGSTFWLAVWLKKPLLLAS